MPSRPAGSGRSCERAARRAQDTARPVPLSALEDTRCDVCLYFVAPHSLRPLDAAMMARIGRLVPVVPIIAKVRPPRSLAPPPTPLHKSTP